MIHIKLNVPHIKTCTKAYTAQDTFYDSNSSNTHKQTHTEYYKAAFRHKHRSVTQKKQLHQITGKMLTLYQRL